MNRMLPATLLLALATAAAAQDAWHAYDGSDTGLGVSGTTAQSRFPIVRIDNQGFPVVAWKEGSGAGDIYLRRWDGWIWTELGGSAHAGGLTLGVTDPGEPALSIDGRTGRIYVAWSGTYGGSRHIRVITWTGSAWSQVGGDLGGDPLDADQPSIDVDAFGNIGLVYRDGKGLHYSQWGGSLWSEPAALMEESDAVVSHPTLCHAPNGAPIIAWFGYYGIQTTAPAHLRVGRFNLVGSTLTRLGGDVAEIWGPDCTTMTAALAVDGGGLPTVAWHQGFGGPTFVYSMRYDPVEKAWTGNGGIGAADEISAGLTGSSTHPVLAPGTTGTPVAAWIYQPPGGGFPRVYARRWMGTSWLGFGGSDAGTGLGLTLPGARLSIADAALRPAVAWEGAAGTSIESYFKRWGAPPTPLPGPTALAQRTIDGSGILAVGQVMRDTGLTIAGAGPASYPYESTLQVEVKPVGVEFDAAGLVDGPAGASDAARTIVLPRGTLSRGVSYHWRARFRSAVSSQQSAWVSFGENLDPDGADVILLPNLAAPVLAQVALQDSVEGQPLLSGSPLHFQGLATDTDGDASRLEVEVRRQDDALVGQATHGGAELASGALSVVDASLPAGSYRWRLRAVDEGGLASPWTAARDFMLMEDGSTGASACLSSTGSSGVALLGLLLAGFALRRG